MKSIIRNFLSVIRRFKMATLLNILGLSIAFAAFMVIMMQIDFDRNFDRFHTHANSIYRLEMTGGGSGQAVISRPMAETFFQSSPHILAGTITNAYTQKVFFSVEENGKRNNYQETTLRIDASFPEVFEFDMYEGVANALEEPDKVLIPLSLAQKIFGNESAINRQLNIRDGATLTVGGVYHDFPLNSIISNCIYWTIPVNENKNSWGNSNYYVYLKVDNPENVIHLVDNYKENVLADINPWGESFSWEEAGMDLRLTVLPEIHFITDVAYDSTPKSSRQTLSVLFAIAIVIVVIAGINFTNFSTALTPMRIKSINTQKVLGGEEHIIRMSLILEAVLISLFSFLLSLIFLHLLTLSPLINLLDADPAISKHPLIISGTGLLAIFTGLLAGLYPSRYMTSFPPALVLKGSFGLSPKGRSLRNGLISIQFIASFSLIIGAFFMYLQNHFMQNTPLGYEKDEIIVTNINGEINKSLDAFINQLKSFSGITDVTSAQFLMSSQDQYMGWGRKYKSNDIQFQCLPVDPTFLSVIGVEVTEGRNFREEDELKEKGSFIFNQRAKEMFDLELNTEVEEMGEIIGFMPDVKFASFRTEVTPMAFFVWGTDNWGISPGYAYIRVSGGTNLYAAIQHIRTTLKEFDPEYPFNVRFFDEVLNQLYEKEKNLTLLITLFSLVAIFISMVGVFGLVVFDSEYRKKEIGIRKVLGSTTGQILIMFNKDYVRILIICFILAAPTAWYVVARWLENFAYRTPMHWWVYLLSFTLVSVITMITVTFQNWRAANDNPINSIKTE